MSNGNVPENESGVPVADGQKPTFRAGCVLSAAFATRH